MLHRQKNLRRQEAEFEDLLAKLQHKVEETELTPEKREARRAKTSGDSPEAERAFCTVYFPEIFSAPWNDLHVHLSELRAGSHTISGFRQAGKTAYTYVGKVIRRIVQAKQNGLVGVNLRTLDKAKARTKLLSRMIQRSRLLQYDYYVEVQQDQAGYHIINDVHLIAGSYQTGLRAYVDDQFNRFQLAVNDDLYDRQSVDSERDNEKVTNFVTSEVRGMMEDDGLDITLGNAISADCPIVRLKEQNPEGHFSLPALDEDGSSTWPEVYSAADWQANKAEMPYDVWMGEYMDQPAVKGDVFEPEWLRTVNLSLLRILASITTVDPSHGQSPHACYKGITTLGLDQDKEPVVLDLYGRRAPYEQVFDYLLQVRRRFGAHHKAILFENDFSQWNYAQPYYRGWQEKRGVTLPIVMHLASETATEFRGADKESRILNLVHPHQVGQFRYASEVTGTADWELFRRQYLAFGRRNEKLDILDALATAYIMIRRYTDSGTFKPLGKRQFARPSWTGGFH